MRLVPVQQHLTEVAVRLGQERVDHRGLAEVGQGSLEIAQEAQGVAEVAACQGKIGT